MSSMDPSTMTVKKSKGCFICYNSNNISSEVDEPEKVARMGLTYLHSEIANKDTGNDEFDGRNQVRLCKNCLDATMELTQLNEQLSNTQKKISDGTIAFSLAVLHRRSETDGHENKQNAMLTGPMKRIIKLDVSGFSTNLFASNSWQAENNIKETGLTPVNIQNSEDSVNTQGTQVIHQNPPSTLQDSHIENVREVEVEDSGNLWTNCHIKVENDDMMTNVLVEDNQDNHGRVVDNDSSGKNPRSNQTTSDILNTAKPPLLVVESTQDTQNAHQNPPSTLPDTPHIENFREEHVEDSVSGNLMANCCIKMEEEDMVTNLVVEENQGNHEISLNATKREYANKAGTSESAPGSFNNRSPSNLRTAQLKKESTSRRPMLLRSETTAKKVKSNTDGLKQSRKNKIVKISTRSKDIKTGSFKCPKCPQIFPSKYKLSIHLRFHASKCVYQCSFCVKVFLNPSECRNHEVCHSEEKLFPCQECNKRFKRPNSLKRHERIHNGKMFKCTSCGKSFMEMNRLRNHEKHHAS